MPNTDWPLICSFIRSLNATPCAELKVCQSLRAARTRS